MRLSTAAILPAVSTKDAAPEFGRYPDRVLLVASLAAAVAFIAIGIQRPVWLDEANSLLISSRSFSGIVAALRVDNNFPLYYFLLAPWMRLFGDSEIALRSLSAIFYLGGAGAVYLIGKDFCAQTRAAWYSAFFYMASAVAIRSAQNIRMYSLLGMLSAFALLSLLRLLRGNGSWPARIFFTLAHTAGLLTHPWFAFVAAAEAVLVLLLDRKHFVEWLRAIIPAAILFSVLWGPEFLNQLRNQATDWMPPFEQAIWLDELLGFYTVIPSLALYVLAAAAWLMQDRAKRKTLLRDKGIALLLVFFAATLALPLLASWARPIYWPGRYAIIALAPLSAVLGVVLSSTIPRPILPLAALLLLVFGVTQQLAHRNDTPEADLEAGQSDRTTAQFLLSHAAPGDAIVFTSLTRAAADYYFRRSHAADRFVEISFPAETAQHLGWLDLGFSPDRRGRLETEAAAIVSRLQQLEAAGRKVWMYDGYARQVSSVLKLKLDAANAPPHVYPLRGPYHQRILAYFAQLAPVAASVNASLVLLTEFNNSKPSSGYSGRIKAARTWVYRNWISIWKPDPNPTLGWRS